MQRTDVIVVGAGPTGLLLAGELALQGVRVTVLERLREPDPTIKSGSVNVASAEILDRRGLLPAAEEVHRRRVAAAGALATGRANATATGLLKGIKQTSRRFPVMGHFAGIMFRNDLVDQEDPALAAHTAVANGVAVPQYELELLLAEHCTRLGAEIRRGVAVHGIRETGADLTDGAGVTVETGAGAFTAGWVVAADGGRSVIRKQLGIDFPGTDPAMVGYQAIADFDDPSGLHRGWTWTPRGVYAYGPVPGRILVARFGRQPENPENRDAPVTREELQEMVRDVTGVHVTIEGVQGRVTRWSDNARQAAAYRAGRVLLAGDAAHVHSPFSAQGLNLGLGDAVNLGWKLAATVQGWAPEGLLDTYESERHPIAAWVLDWTRAQVALLRGDERTARLRKVVGDELFTVPGAMNRMVALSSGIQQHYAVADGADDAEGPVGSLVGDAWLTSGGRLADHAHDGRFLLLDRSHDGRFAEAVRQLGHRIAYLTDPDGDPDADAGRAPAPGPTSDTSPPSLLVRPDGVVIWSTAHGEEPADDTARKRLDSAISRWAGAR
ncbi:FAD-dependent oxidoreductase [Streptomyces iconiensis]|uniref:FAD-dependent oxidoreductase n=1 Tax=Streptomyces iconiensis TaxID=1384038 RepID=A0ABT6ZX36_9ACTN|nr:FAD-dependent oxidoreductase [Streptomyces iconiensis]MDJ1133639.1 FAD-dependent oxidoreductase [Streptomyces iconiensis]